MDYSRIQKAVNTNFLKNTHIIGVGAGGAYCLYEALVRSGIGKLTVLDIDTVDDVNLCRQGFYPDQVGMMKVDALKEHLLRINPELDYTGITDDMCYMHEPELKEKFGGADLLLFLTDSFMAQAVGQIISTSMQTPAIWGGYYDKSECSEIIFQIPGVTQASFKQIVQSRYDIYYESGKEATKVSSNCNTMFHSQLIDSMIGMLAMAILHNNIEGYTFSDWFGEYWDRNLIQFKVSPDYESKLFDDMLVKTDGKSILFNSFWQQIY